MLVGITTEGALRVEQIETNDLVFSVTHVAYGSGGFAPLDPYTPSPLNPAVTALSSQVFMKELPPGSTIKNTVWWPRGQETTYTSLGGKEYSGIIGEAGLYATVEKPGTTGLVAGYRFFFAQAHLSRVILTPFDRLAVVFPIQYYPRPIRYNEADIMYEEPGLDYRGR